MNIDQAKEIAIAEILHRLGIEPNRTSSGKLLYLSPVRLEKTPSFYVYLKTNRWHDFGDGRGGDAVDFAKAFLKFTREADTTADALRWLGNMGMAPFVFAPIPQLEVAGEEAALSLRKATLIQHLGLIHYLQKRGIPPALADKHLKQVHVRNQRTGKSFFALGLDNEEGGYELRNPFFKGTLGTKAISFVRGRQPQPATIHLFEGMMDYLSALTQNSSQSLQGDAIVLNSLSCIRQITPYIQDYGYRTACTWLDNDPAGEAATITLGEFFKTQAELTHQPMNRLYVSHKDVNAWHMQQCQLAI